jgi:hypothetical protein
MKKYNFIRYLFVIILLVPSLYAQKNYYQLFPYNASLMTNTDHLNSKIISENKQYNFQITTLDNEIIEIVQIDKSNPSNSQVIYALNDQSFHNGMQDSSLVTLQFDQPNPRFQFINEDFLVSYSDWHSFGPVIKIDDYTFQVYIPPGYYHLWARFEDPDHCIVFRDSIHITGDSTIAISSSEATHRINFRAVDENGQFLTNLPGDHNEIRYSIVYIDSTRSSSSSTNIFENYITVSDMKGPFYISAQQFQNERGSTDILRAVRFTLKTISTETTLTNDPAEFLVQKLKVVYPDNTTSKSIMIWRTTRTNPFGGFGGAGSGYGIENDEWSGKLFINSEPDENVVHSISIGAEINDPDPFDEEYIRLPSLRIVNNQIGSFLGQSPSVADYLSPDGGQLVYGTAPIFASGLHLNNLESPYQIGCYNRVFGPLLEQRNYDMQNARITIFDSSGTQLASMLQSEFEPFETETGRYQTVIISDNYQVGHVKGLGTLRAWYDLEQDDPNPPLITSFRIIDSKGKSILNVAADKQCVIQFSAADFYYADTVSNDHEWQHLKYQSILKDSTRVWIREHDTNPWQELTIQEELEESGQERIMSTSSAKYSGLVYSFPPGVMYSAAFGSLDLEPTTLDIKMAILDNSGNRTEWILEPACLYDPTDVSNLDDNLIPNKISLYQNYPNPFNTTTIINYELPITNYVELSIHNLLGQKVVTLVSDKQNAGSYQIEWNAAGFASGVYYYRIEAGEFQDVKKMILLQ